MGERPIIFSAPMVRALLDGTKTQTRRLITRLRVCAFSPEIPGFTLRGADAQRAFLEAAEIVNPYEDIWTWTAKAFEYQAPAQRSLWSAQLGFARGDRLWVRENICAEECSITCVDGVKYLADGLWGPIENTREAADRWVDLFNYRGQRGASVPSIHMPRWASRLTLIVESVRVERLQDLSEEDAIAEGIKRSPGGWYSGSEGQGAPDPRSAFALLWQSINAKRAPWQSNPYVVALTFTVHRCNIDALEASTICEAMTP